MTACVTVAVDGNAALVIFKEAAVLRAVMLTSATEKETLFFIFCFSMQTFEIVKKLGLNRELCILRPGKLKVMLKLIGFDTCCRSRYGSQVLHFIFSTLLVRLLILTK